MAEQDTAAMRNAPWDADDREVLREKWRMAAASAFQCEQLLHEVELLRIRVDYVAEQTPEHDELAVDARNMFIAVGQKLFESGLTMADWKWFVENRIPDEPDKWQELGEHCQQAEKLKDLFHCLEEFVRAIAKAKRTFADSIRLSLNAWEEADNPNTSWFQRADNGVRLHGRLVEVSGRDATVLRFLCKRTTRSSTYEDLASLAKVWDQGLTCGNVKTIRSTKSNIRSCLNRIRDKIRLSFGLTKEHEPVKRSTRGPVSGWKLDKDLLQSNSP
jgi:hypothetical protein